MPRGAPQRNRLRRTPRRSPPVASLLLLLSALVAPAKGFGDLVSGQTLSEAGTDFGASCAFDDTSLLVGAPLAISEAGRVELYAGTAYGTEPWTATGVLAPSDLAAGDRFGSSLSLVSRSLLAVGAEGSNGGAGAVYVFEFSGGGWAQRSRLEAAAAQAGDQFGSAVALSGDGVLAVGSPRAGPADTGRVTVFSFLPGSFDFHEGQELTADDPEGNAFFGASLAISGGRLAVGAPWAGSRRGAVYIFDLGPDGEWLQSSKVTLDDAVNLDFFGSSVGLVGSDMVVGAQYDDIDGVTNAGAVYTFSYNGAKWSQVTSYAAPEPAAFGGFGTSVALHGGQMIVGSKGTVFWWPIAPPPSPPPKQPPPTPPTPPPSTSPSPPPPSPRPPSPPPPPPSTSPPPKLPSPSPSPQPARPPPTTPAPSALPNPTSPSSTTAPATTGPTVPAASPPPPLTPPTGPYKEVRTCLSGIDSSGKGICTFTLVFLNPANRHSISVEFETGAFTINEKEGITSVVVNGVELGSCVLPVTKVVETYVCLSDADIEALVDSTRTARVELHHNVYSGLKATLTLDVLPKIVTPAPTPAETTPSASTAPPVLTSAPAPAPTQKSPTPATTQPPFMTAPPVTMPTMGPSPTPPPTQPSHEVLNNYRDPACGFTFEPSSIILTRLSTLPGCVLSCEERTDCVGVVFSRKPGSVLKWGFCSLLGALEDQIQAEEGCFYQRIEVPTPGPTDAPAPSTPPVPPAPSSPPPSPAPSPSPPPPCPPPPASPPPPTPPLPPPSCEDGHLVCKRDVCLCIPIPIADNGTGGTGNETDGDLLGGDDSAENQDADQWQFQVIVDDTLPGLFLRTGNGEPRLSSGGIWQVVHHVTVQDTWEDPGFLATDNFVQSLNGSAIYFANSVVDTSVPTLPSQPIVLTFSIADKAGNQAPPVQRIVHIHCGGDEIVCEGDEWDPTPSCSVMQICRVPSEASSLWPGSPDLFNLATPVRVPIILFLLGPALVEVPVGSTWDKCPPGAGPTDVCDHGALAFLGEDDPLERGTLTSFVKACQPPSGRAMEGSFGTLGLGACPPLGAEPGPNEVVFSVADPNDPGNMAIAARVVWVVPVCEEGEHVCQSRLECSVDKICLRSDGTIDLDSALEALVDPEKPVPPQLSLLGFLGPFVTVQQHQPYAKCMEGKQATSESPCEEGAWALDASTGRDITSQVYVLPGHRDAGATCLERSCIGHEFWHRNIDSGLVDTEAPVGSTFVLSFVAVGDNGGVATVNRIITIGRPCEDITETWCSGQCYPVSCDRLPDLGIDVSTEPPALTLAGGDFLNVGYGMPVTSPASLLPCASITDAADGMCGAWAKAGSGADLSSSIEVIETTECQDTAICRFCSPEQVGSMSEPCLPGLYRYRYRVTDPKGRSATAVRTVVISESARITVLLTLTTRAVSEAQVATIVSGLEDPASTANRLLRQAFSASLNSVQPTLRLTSDLLSVLRVTSQQSTGRELLPGYFVYRIHVVITVTLPLQSSTAAAARRSLLQDQEAQALAVAMPNALSSTTFVGGISRDPDLAVSVASIEGEVRTETLERITPNLDFVAGQAVSLSSQVQMLLDSADEMQSILDAAQVAIQEEIITSQGLAEEADLAHVQRITKSYSVFLEEALAASSVLEVDAVEVKELFHRTLELQQSLVKSLSEVSDSIKDGIAAAQLFARTLAETQEFLDSVVGPMNADGARSPCLATAAQATGQYKITFSLRAGGLAAKPASGRRLQAVDHDGYGPWDGYHICSPSPSAGRGSTDLSDAPELPRWLGASKGGNRLMGGLVINQIRTGLDPDACEGRYSDLSASCAEKLFYERLVQVDRTADNVTARYLEALRDPLRPFGADPVFIRGKTLYNPMMVGRQSDFYNTSRGSQDVNINSFPNAFFPRELLGSAEGFALVVPPHVDAHRAATLWASVGQGNFLDSHSKEMRAQLLSFNPSLRVFAYADSTFSWTPGGLIQFVMRQPRVVPALTFSRAVVGTLGAMVFLVVVFAAAHLPNILSHLASKLHLDHYKPATLISKGYHPGGVKEKHAHQSQGHGALFLDGLLLSLMVAGLSAYVVSMLMVNDITGGTDYDIYDAVHVAPARFFLPDKAEATKEILTGVGGPDAPTAAPVDALPAPGGANRWQLQSNSTGMEALGASLSLLSKTSQAVALSTGLQGLALLVMVIRLLHVWAFQPRLGVITLSILLAAPDLLVLGITVVVVLVLLASMGHLALGSVFVHLSTPLGALSYMFFYLLSGEDWGLHAVVAPPGEIRNQVDLLNSRVFYVMLPFLVGFILLSFLLAIMARAYYRARARQGNPQGIFQEVRLMMRARRAICRWLSHSLGSQKGRVPPSDESWAERMRRLSPSGKKFYVMPPFPDEKPQPSRNSGDAEIEEMGAGSVEIVKAFAIWVGASKAKLGPKPLKDILEHLTAKHGLQLTRPGTEARAAAVIVHRLGSSRLLRISRPAPGEDPVLDQIEAVRKGVETVDRYLVGMKRQREALKLQVREAEAMVKELVSAFNQRAVMRVHRTERRSQSPMARLGLMSPAAGKSRNCAHGSSEEFPGADSQGTSKEGPPPLEPAHILVSNAELAVPHHILAQAVMREERPATSDGGIRHAANSGGRPGTAPERGKGGGRMATLFAPGGLPGSPVDTLAAASVLTSARDPKQSAWTDLLDG